MAASAKAQKDRPHVGQPKLLPRPTASSAARAAKHAINRNNPIGPSSHSAVTSHSSRTSPTRSPVQKNISSPGQVQPKVQKPDRQILKSDSKTSVKNIPIINEELQATVDFIEITVSPDNKEEKVSLNESKGSREDDCPETNSDNAKMSSNSSYVIGQPQEEDSPNATDDMLIISTSELPISRPQTPISVSHSRPTSAHSRPSTPCAKSRPTTPSTKSRSRPSTPRHSCNTNSSHSRPTTPRLSDKRNKSGIPTPVVRSSAHPRQSPQAPISPAQLPNNEDEDLMSIFLAKEKEFQRMKRELDLKQQAVIQIYDYLRSLRERMTREGMTGAGEGGQNLELKVIDVAGWSEEELERLCKDKIAEGCVGGAIDLLQNSRPFDETRLSDLEEKATTLAQKVTEFCLETIHSRQEFLEWVQKQFDDQDCQSKDMFDQFDAYNKQGISICESLQKLKECTYSVMMDISQMARQACQDKAVLWTAGDTLVREVFRLKQNQEMLLDVDENGKTIEDIRQQLEEERASHEKDKEKLTTTETQLKQARGRISKMDRQIREAETNIVNLASAIKNMENESRQKDIQFEAKARKLRDSLKTGEVTNNYISQQRNTLMQEVKELKDKIATITEQHKETINGLNQQIKSLKQSLEEQKEITMKEAQLKEEAEDAIKEHLAQIEQLQAKVYELECLKPSPDTPTEREMELWAELEATKDAMHHLEDEISTCKREKIRFLETLTKIADSENKVGIQQKLAAELLNKEECMNKMQVQIRELTKNIKVNEQKVIQYDQYIRSLQVHIRNVAAGKETENSDDYSQVQNEIMVLRVKLIESGRKIEELTDQLNQKEQQLDQQGKTSRTQARVIKVREELINMLKNKESEQTRELAALQKDLEHRMKIVEEVNHQIETKAGEIQELFTTLDSKQQQIHRLEKIVLALEEQQRRAQAQRTRHEEKIAALEHELAAGGSRRERRDGVTSPMPPRSPGSSRNYLIQRNRDNNLVLNWKRVTILMVGVFLLCMLVVTIITVCLYIISRGPKTKMFSKMIIHFNETGSGDFMVPTGFQI